MKFRQLVASLLCLAILTQSTGACMWDRDTLAYEARGHHETLNVISGRFPRNPPIFYEVRLNRVTEEIATSPEKLELYDDAGVACDRLGRSAEAIGWMEKKAAALEKNPDKDHQYRYHANLGTFLIHQWLKGGADPAKPEGEQGAEHIRRAIEINPEAHFGRERVQLMAIDWILTEQKWPSADEKWRGNLLETDGYPNSELTASITPEDAIEGLSGMITLGAAWESIDIYNALAHALSADGKATMAYLANKRIRELHALGKRSLYPRAETDWVPMAPELVEETPPLDLWYTDARKAAAAWQYERTAFIESQIGAGKHPDTHARFWNGFDENSHPLPDFPKSPPSGLDILFLYAKQIGFTLLGIGAIIHIAFLIRRLRKRRREQLIA